MRPRALAHTGVLSSGPLFTRTKALNGPASAAPGACAPYSRPVARLQATAGSPLPRRRGCAAESRPKAGWGHPTSVGPESPPKAGGGGLHGARGESVCTVLAGPQPWEGRCPSDRSACAGVEPHPLPLAGDLWACERRAGFGAWCGDLCVAVPHLHLHQRRSCGQRPLCDVRLGAPAGRTVAPPHAGAAARAGAWSRSPPAVCLSR